MRRTVIHVLSSIVVLIPLLLFSQDIPYSTGFESPTYTAGSLDTQDGWSVEAGTATVQTTKKHSGTQAVELEADTTIGRLVDGTGYSIVWAEGYYSGNGISGTPELPATPEATAIIFFSSVNGIQCLNGDGSGGGTFVNTGVTPSSSVWHKITIKFNFTTQKWDCYINDVLKANNLGFRDSVTKFNGFKNFSKIMSYFDDFKVVPSLKGDATLDNSVDVVDVILLINHLNANPAQTDPIMLDNMDFNSDGGVTSADLSDLLDYILGK